MKRIVLAPSRWSLANLMLRRLLKTAMVLFSLPQLVITDPAARDIILNPDMKRIVLEEQFWRRVTYLCTILDPVCRALGVSWKQQRGAQA